MTDFIYFKLKLLPTFEWYSDDLKTQFIVQPRSVFEEEKAWIDEHWEGLDELLPYDDGWDNLMEGHYLFRGSDEDALQYLLSAGVEESKEFRDCYMNQLCPDAIGHIEE